MMAVFAVTTAFAGETAGPVASTDAAAPSATTAPAAAARPDEGGKWRLTVETSPADGTKVITATLPANAPIPSGFGQATPELIIRYKAGRPSAYVVFDTFLGHGGNLEARVTFGTEPAEVQKWKISGDSRAAFVAGEPLAFIERLKQADALTVQVSPAKGASVTASFSPVGIELVMRALISAGVKYGGN